MRKTTLTAAAVDKLKPPASGQAEYFDASFPGLACRISHGGTKSWIYLYRAHGTKRRLTLGRWPAMSLAEAREAWRAARKAVDRGEDPAAKRPANDFASVADEWLARDQAHNRSRAEVERVINRDVKPIWKGRLITDIRRTDCIRLIDTIADRGAVTMARRTHAYLNRLFRWALGRGLVEASPMMGLPKPGVEVARDRVLSDDELVRVWRAAEGLGWPFGHAVRLLILTAGRREEVTALRWREVQGDTLVLEQTKSTKAHGVPLSDSARAILDDVPRIQDSEFVFTTTGRTPISGWSKAKLQIDEKAGDMPAWRLHDLRRTAATGMQRLGISLQVVEAVLGHISGSRAGVVGIYQRHEYADEKRRALTMWADHIEGLLSGQASNVVPIRERTI